jgi:hypothetical protein
VKRNHAKPCGTIERVDFQPGRHARAHRIDGHRPVSKEQIVPALLHDPRLRRQRPRPVAHIVDDICRKVVQPHHLSLIEQESIRRRTVVSSGSLKAPEA